jgi:hypothetical protein
VGYLPVVSVLAAEMPLLAALEAVICLAEEPDLVIAVSALP